MDDKRYQVFVSSTYEDLKEERQEVMHALLELGCIPSGMELFPAADESQWELIKKVIDDCDYYLLILGGRYGCLSPSGVGYTEMEYRYALSANKPIVAFLHKDPSSIAAKNTEDSQDGKRKLAAFRKLTQQKLCKFWITPSELGSVVSRSVVQLIRTTPAVGWIRATTKTDGSHFFQRIPASRAEAIKGTWIGHVDQSFGPAGTSLRSEIRFDLKVRGLKVEGQGIATVPYDVGNVIVTRFVLAGGFFHERFLRVDYNPEDSTTIQFGAAILLLRNNNEVMEGRFVGYGLQTEKVIEGEVSLKKEKD